MPIWLMVFIDRWVGGLLVTLLSPFAVLHRHSPVAHYQGFGPNPPIQDKKVASRPPKLVQGQAAWALRVIVVSKFFGMGSIILAIPLLRQIRARFPSAQIVFLSFQSNQRLLRFVPYIDEVLCIRTAPHLFAFDTLKTVWMLQRKQVELFFELESYSRYSTLISFCSGARTRVGFHTVSLPRRGRLLTHRVYWNLHRHALENFLALGGAVGIPPGDRSLALRGFTAAEERKGLVWLRKKALASRGYILFSPFSDSGKELKAYSKDGWRELAEMLHRRTGLHIVVIGAHADRQWDPKLLGVGNYFHNLTGKTSFTALMVIVEHATYLVSVDTGITHLAAVFHTPTLTLFGPETPELYGPLNPRGQVMYANLHCSPCLNLLEGKRSDCRNNVCINQWSPEEICKKVLAGLETARS